MHNIIQDRSVILIILTGKSLYLLSVNVERV
jgi:hypothetical protein